MKVDDASTSLEEVQSFLLTQGVRSMTGDSIPELEPTLLAFLKKPNVDGIDNMDKEIRKMGELSPAREATTAMLLKVMNTIVKKVSDKKEEDGLKYVEKELARVQGMMKSSAVTDVKKKEMELKVKALNVMSGAIASEKAAKTEL
jgi:hypothetical protein